jgi:hypothetical protein
MTKKILLAALITAGFCVCCKTTGATGLPAADGPAAVVRAVYMN